MPPWALIACTMRLLIRPDSTISTTSTVAASLTRLPSTKLGLDVEPLQHVVDHRPAAVHHHRVDVALLHQHHVAGELVHGLVAAHGVAAELDDDGRAVVALQVGQRLAERAGGRDPVAGLGDGLLHGASPLRSAVGPCAGAASAGYYPRPPRYKEAARALAPERRRSPCCSAALRRLRHGARPGRAGGGADCVALFQHYDLAEATMSTPGGRRDRMAIPPALQRPVQRLQQAGCITLSADLAGMEAAGGPPVVDSGAAIAPISLHAGVVTNMEDEAARDRLLRGARGARPAASARRGSGGASTSGRSRPRARSTARAIWRCAAGFAAPYPATF